MMETKSVTKINVSKTNSSETEFEVEGLAMNSAGKLFMGVNTDGVEDAVYLVK